MGRNAAMACGGAVVLLATAVATLAARQPPCPAGTFVVDGGPLLPGAPATQIDTLTITPDPAAVELSIGCGPANAIKPDKVRGAKRGTKVRATWKTCAGLASKVRLKGLVVDDCATFRGKLRAKGIKRPFQATRAGGATCDPLASPGSQGCQIGEKCTWLVLADTPDVLGETACVPDGSKQLGEPCATGPAGESTGFDDCAAGGICIAGQCADVCGFDGSPEAACADGGYCTRFAGVFGNGTDDPIAGACLEGCNPLTQLRTSGNPCPFGQGCYPIVDATTTIAVCAAAGTLAHGDLIPDPVFANSCAPGLIPRLRDQVSNDVECGALCQVTDVYQGNNEADEGGVAPYTCMAKGAAAPDDPVNGESCRYWWAQESFDTLSPFSNTLGWCFKHAAFSYDSNGDSVNDAPFPRCVTLTTGDVVPPISDPPQSDALYFWCTALPAP